jgi:phosphoribosylanthranilate isomerase
MGCCSVRPWAVDVSSGVEAAKGVKNAALMRRFCKAVREADARIAASDEAPGPAATRRAAQESKPC